MGSYFLTIDSSNRILDEYPDSNDYVFQLNRPLYDVSSIELVSGCVPFSGYTVDSYNDTFYFNDEPVILSHKNYTDGAVLANDLETAIHDSTANNVSFHITYDSSTNTLTFHQNQGNYSLVFTDGSPCATLGFVPGTYESDVGGDVVSGSIDMTGPTVLYLSLTPDTKEYLKSETHTKDDRGYIGTVIRKGDSGLTRLIRDDNVLHYTFPRGLEPSIRLLRVQFWVNNYGKMVPYDFKLQDHLLKFEIKCTLDKLNKKPTIRERFELPPVLNLQEFAPRPNKAVLVYGGAAFVLILIVMILTSFKHVSLRTRAGRGA